MVLKYYFDLLSQPSRALYIFLKSTRIPFEECPVALRKGEHLGDNFAAINPFKKVPAIDDDGFRLSESWKIANSQVLGGKKVPNDRYLTGIDKCLTEIEEIFLPNSNGFIFDLGDVSFADLLCCCELEQPLTAGIAVLDGHPKVAAYKERVRQRLSPVYDEAHSINRVLHSKIVAGKL